MKLLKPKARLQVYGEERLLTEKEPYVMICNHGMWYMPVAAILNLKVDFRPWIHDVMLKKESCQAEIDKMLTKIPSLSQRMKRALSSYVTKLVCRVLNDFDPIPVSRGCSRDVLGTLQTSIDALVNGENLLIFPEIPRCDCQNIDEESQMAEQLRQLYTGFAQLGRLYFSRTGKKLKFFPIYINRQKESLEVGEVVCYENMGDSIAEKQAISRELYRRLSLMSSH